MSSFERTGNLPDISEAISVNQRVVRLTPNDIRIWFTYPAISALSVFASCRFSPVSLYWSYSPTSDANNTNVYASSDMYNAWAIGPFAVAVAVGTGEVTIVVPVGILLTRY